MLVTASPALANSYNANPNSSGYQVPAVAQVPPSSTASCPAFASSPLLSSLGDSANYAPVAGGTFEDAVSPWTFNNASVVSGNEPWNVVSSTDSHEANISPGGSATSPSFCVDSTVPSFRFFAQSLGSGSLTVSAKFTLSNGYTGSVPLTSLSSGNYSSWTLGPSIALGSQLPAGMTATVQFVFSADNGGAWNIDDVLLDPYAK